MDVACVCVCWRARALSYLLVMWGACVEGHHHTVNQILYCPYAYYQMRHDLWR